MKKKRLFFLLICLFSVNALFGVPFDMILAGDPILDDIRFLSIQSGRAFLSFTPPLAPAEVILFLESIDEASLPPAAKDAYHRVLERLIPNEFLSISTKYFSGFLNINASFEGRVRFNDEVPWEPQDAEFSPMISFPFRFCFSNIVQLYMEPIVSILPEKYDSEIYDLNIPTKGSHMGSEFPLRAFLAAGGPWWNFQIGQDKLSWGTAHTESLSFSDNSDYQQFARLSFFAPFLKYSVLVTQMPLSLENRFFETPSLWIDENSFNKSVNRYFYMHRIDFMFFKRVSLGFMEGIMVGNSPLELRYLSPLGIFHYLFAWFDYERWNPPNPSYEGDMVGSFFSIELNVNLFKSFSFYGQFVLQEFALGSESNNNPDQPPNGLGYLAGVNYTRSIKNWGAAFFAEFLYTDPYLNILSSPYGSMIYMDIYDRYKYFGAPRDTMSLTFGADFFDNDKLSFFGRFSWISEGEHDRDGIQWLYEYTQEARDKKTPSGNKQDNFIASLGATWKVTKNFTLFTSITGLFSTNNKHSGQAAFALRFHL